jgi:hypothetical protein
MGTLPGTFFFPAMIKNGAGHKSTDQNVKGQYAGYPFFHPVRN